MYFDHFAMCDDDLAGGSRSPYSPEQEVDGDDWHACGACGEWNNGEHKCTEEEQE